VTRIHDSIEIGPYIYNEEALARALRGERINVVLCEDCWFGRAKQGIRESRV
jgi:hypothetical protein